MAGRTLYKIECPHCGQDAGAYSGCGHCAAKYGPGVRSEEGWFYGWSGVCVACGQHISIPHSNEDAARHIVIVESDDLANFIGAEYVSFVQLAT